MKVYVLYEGNDDYEQGDIFHECYGVFLTKESALNAYENIEYLYYEDQYEDDLDQLCCIIERDKKLLEETGQAGDYILFETELKE